MHELGCQAYMLVCNSPLAPNPHSLPLLQGNVGIEGE